MKPRHAYARVTHAQGNVEIVAGVAILPRERAAEVYKRIERTLSLFLPSELTGRADDDLADDTERLLKFEFPDLYDRGFFLEVGRGDLDQYVQVYVA
jgi:hypothetical protein